MAVQCYPASKEIISDVLTDIKAFLIKLEKDEQSIAEYELLTENLLLKLIEAAEPEHTLSVYFNKKRCGSNIVLSCGGAPLSLINSDYAERISQTRKHGINQITVSIGTSSNSLAVSVAKASLLAVLSGVVLCLFSDTAQIIWLNKEILFPIIMLFIKLLQNLAVPIAFISLITYIINFYNSVQFEKQLRKVALRFIASSVFATVIPFSILALTGLTLSGDANDEVGGLSLRVKEVGYMLGDSPKEILNGLLPNNLLEIFTIANPLPMLLIAILFGIGINSYSGESNQLIRRGMNAAKDLLSQIVAFVFSLLPFFFYTAVLNIIADQYILHEIPKAIKNLGVMGALILLMFAIHCGVYIVYLKRAGISIKAFIIKYKDMLWENLKIGSNMDALPYNIRMFRQKLHNSQKDSFVRAALNLGANVNMDGNCLIITTTIMFFLFSVHYRMDILFLVEMMVIILLLGIGCPNQPGSFTIAMLVLIGFFRFSPKLYLVVILFEGLFFKLYSAINAIGDIVAVVTVVDDELRGKL